MQNPVTFYAAGNEANGDGTNQGDYIYMTSEISNVVSTPTTTPSATPVATPTQTPSTSVTPKIAAGIVHNIALDSDGNIWTWGNNWYGQLGDGTTSNRYTPIRVGSLNDATAIAGGYMFTLALKSDGTVWVCGFNEYGQLILENDYSEFYTNMLDFNP